MTQQTFAFILGRESKLSLAELCNLYGSNKLITWTEHFAIFSLSHFSQTDLMHLGGSLRVIRILEEGISSEHFTSQILLTIKESKHEGKYTFALANYGIQLPIFDMGMRIKKMLLGEGISARLVNHENTNIHSAVFKKEKLAKQGGEFCFLQTPQIGYFGITIAAQDIDDYSRRDTTKERDMIVGMLPPKLAQMMINLSRKNSEDLPWIYDPFCGLGTVLIEAANMNILSILGSDINPDMVTATQNNINSYIETEKVWYDRITKSGGTPKKNIHHLKSEIFLMDATEIEISMGSENLRGHNIVSEWYLGDIMHPRSITIDKVQKERRKLATMYRKFFVWLKNLHFTGDICMTFPFWDIAGKYSFFSEIHDILSELWYKTIPLLPEDEELTTKKWTLLYKRPGQTVWREVWHGRLR